MPAWLFGLTFFGSSCVVSLVSGLVTGSPAGALHASCRYVPVVRTGVPVWASIARWLGHCRPLWPATMWENKVSHLGNSLIMIITAKILKYS